MSTNKNVRIRTTPGGEDKYLKVKLEQDVDNLEILSLRISQAEAYKRVCSDYGVIVGRAIANGGVGVPNAKISVFIPLSDDDAENELIKAIYPFTSLTEDTGIDKKRYNLFPDHNSKNDKCYTPIGSFPSKRKLLDNDILLEIHEKYYKFTTTTNKSGDYMLFGVPVGNHTLHMDVDMSDIGALSQKPYDLIREGSNIKIFESTTKFKGGNDLNTLAQVKSANTGINVVPFWGDIEECQIGINRFDFEIPTRIEPFSFFMGSIFSDNGKFSISQRCRLKKKIGNICDTVTGEGTIEMIRKTPDGLNEVFTVEGGRVIDENGAWAYQIPMNLEYKVTNEFGELVNSTEPNVGIPTRSDVRFRITMDMTGSEGRNRRRASYLIPNNPNSGQPDYTFDSNTTSDNFSTMYWNNIYTVRNFIGRFQAVKGLFGGGSIRDFLGVKNVDDCGSHTPFPYNRYDTSKNVLFTIMCTMNTIVVQIARLINLTIIRIINTIIGAINILPKVNIGKINCIPINCDDKDYKPGCKGYPDDNEDVQDCLQASLADALDVFKFDFYNDWVNGTLYFPQFKYKKKKNGRELFCDVDYNKTRKNYITETCLNTGTDFTKNDSKSRSIGKCGMVKKKNEKFYYAAKPKTDLNSNLLATDITNLGPIEECSPLLKNNFFLINAIPDTTYDRQPNGRERDDEVGSPTKGTLLTSGIDGVIMNITCLGIESNETVCDNTKVICELGMGIDEAIDIGSATSENVIGANEVLNANDLFNEPARAKLISNNLNIAYNANQTFVGDVNYEDYRDFNSNGSFKVPYENSFYFYFGIIPGKSAIQKFNTKYRTECLEEVETTFLINVVSQTNNTAVGTSIGAVDIEIIGGSGNYQYEWYDSSNTTIATSQDVTGLAPGNYRVEVTDLNTNKTATREVEILGPTPPSIVIDPTPVTTFGAFDGELAVSIFGGTAPYTLEMISGPSSPLSIPGSAITGTPPGGTFTSLSAGDYEIRVTDANALSETVSVTLTGPTQLIVDTSTSTLQTTCGDDNGEINISASGGTSPYTFLTTKSGASIPNGDNTNIPGLSSGTYTITVEDSATVTQTTTETVIILPSTEITITQQPFYFLDAASVPFIVVLTSGGSLPLTYRLFKDGTSATIADNTTGSFNATGLASGNYKIEIEDADGCLKTTNIVSVP